MTREPYRFFDYKKTGYGQKYVHMLISLLPLNYWKVHTFMCIV